MLLIKNQVCIFPHSRFSFIRHNKHYTWRGFTNASFLHVFEKWLGKDVAAGQWKWLPVLSTREVPLQMCTELMCLWLIIRTKLTPVKLQQKPNLWENTYLPDRLTIQGLKAGCCCKRPKKDSCQSIQRQETLKLLIIFKHQRRIWMKINAQNRKHAKNGRKIVRMHWG